MKNKLAWAIGTWFGCGFAPIAPGTVGSIGAIIPAVLLSHYAGWPGWWFAALAVLATPVSIWAAGVVAIDSGRKDPGLVVVDEVLGQWITLAGASVLDWRTFLIGFLLFRGFDIWKPPPVRQLEKLPGGAGIVADDLMAGVYGALVLAAVGRLLP